MNSVGMEIQTMVREDGKRNFALRETDGSESSVFQEIPHGRPH
ncbi:MAG: non-histone chromosomal protein MC1 [uncultured archaeon A07HN63]|nr:MAG: non-histone chromosomal protein MC1 [uncultured archaeon A07HN63]